MIEKVRQIESSETGSTGVEVLDAGKLGKLGGGAKEIVPVVKEQPKEQQSRLAGQEDGGAYAVKKGQTPVTDDIASSKNNDNLVFIVNNYAQERRGWFKLPSAFRQRVFNVVNTLGTSEEDRLLDWKGKFWKHWMRPVFVLVAKILTLWVYKGPEEKLNMCLVTEITERVRGIMQGRVVGEGERA